MADGAFSPLDGANTPTPPPPPPDAEPLRLPMPAPNGEALPDLPSRATMEARAIYYDADGLRPLGCVDRIDLPGGHKTYLPTIWTADRWVQKQWSPGHRPLYHLDLLAQKPDAPVLVVEGEKAARAALCLALGHIPTTSPGGAHAAAHADWSPMDGRRVVIWPDADPPGEKYADTVAHRCHAAGAASVAVVALPADLPTGWDLADDLPAGWTGETIAQMIRDATPVPPPSPATPDAPPPADTWPAWLPAGYAIEADGIWRDGARGPVHVCGPLAVEGLARGADGAGWSVLVSWRDPDGRPCEAVVPRADLGLDGWHRPLADRGLVVCDPRSLARLLTIATPPERVRLISRPGWAMTHGRPLAFALGRDVIHPDGAGPMVYRGPVPDTLPATGGTLDGWRDVAALAAGNPRLILALCAAVVGPALALLGADTLGVHLYGRSSTGKSTAARLAASVWGPPGMVGSWRATDNGLEGIAEIHNDRLLVLDEMGQAPARSLGEAAYMLGNGTGKVRMRADGDARAVKRWRVAVLSTGEVTLGARLGEAAQKATAGQEVRLVEVPADAGVGHGLYDRLHGHPGGAALSGAIAAATGQHYGHAGPAYVRHLLADPDDARHRLAAARDLVLETLTPSGADGQVGRVAGVFGLLAAAGEHAARAGILPLSPGDIVSAMDALFLAWLGARGTSGPAEHRAIIDHVRDALVRYGESRFERLDADAPRPVERWGWVRHRDGETEWLIPAEGLKRMVPGHDPRMVRQVLHGAGHLRRSANRLTLSERLGGQRVWVAAVLGSILEGDAGPD